MTSTSDTEPDKSETNKVTEEAKSNPNNSNSEDSVGNTPSSTYLPSLPPPCTAHSLSGSGLIYLARMSTNPFAIVGSSGGAAAGEEEGRTSHHHSIIRPSVLASAHTTSNSNNANGTHNHSSMGMKSFLKPSRLSSSVGLSAPPASSTSPPPPLSSSQSSTSPPPPPPSSVSLPVQTSANPVTAISTAASSTSSSLSSTSSSSSLPATKPVPDSPKETTGNKEKEETADCTKTRSAAVDKDDAAPVASTDSGVHYVFGSNMGERVVNAAAEAVDDGVAEDGNVTTTSSTLEHTEGDVKKGLEESARVLEERQEQTKPKLDEIKVMTGEEDECNALQMNGKLYFFCSDKHQWLERGSGTLKLNDKRASGQMQSRLVFRTHGIYKLVLNTKIWAAMSLDMPSEKSVRFSAQDLSDPTIIRMYLVKGNSKDVDHLYTAVHSRIARCPTTTTPGEDDDDTSSPPDKKRPKVD